MTTLLKVNARKQARSKQRVTEKVLDDRLEAQDLRIEHQLGQHTTELKNYIDQKIDRAMASQIEGIKHHTEILVEHVQDEVGGKYSDWITLIEKS